MMIVAAVVLLLIAIGQFTIVLLAFKDGENTMPFISLIRLFLCIVICILVFRRI